MKLLGVLVLVKFAVSIPLPSDAPTAQITDIFLQNKLKIYTSEHDIVNIYVPLNDLNLNDVYSDKPFSPKVLFFVEGDFKNDGTFDNKGLFILNVVTGEATKLLDNGVDMTAGVDDGKNAYFAATDGIYVYNGDKNTTEKYGSITESIISIAKPYYKDVIYALTADKNIYKVTENGEKKAKVEDVKNAHQIVLDDEENIYYYDDQKQIKVLSTNGVKTIEGLPEHPNKITLLRPYFAMEESVPVLIDDKVYVINANGTSQPPFKLIAHLTAFSMESSVVVYFAYNKSIYKYN